jgi:hypothetical protein
VLDRPPRWRSETEEDIMFGTRVGFVGRIIVIALVLVVGVGTGASFADGPPDWQKALTIRSKGLDHLYRLDTYANTIARRYHLDVSTRTSASAAPAWLKALVVRSDALDRAYHLGAYAPRP